MDRENPQRILNVSASTPRTAGACQPPSVTAGRPCPDRSADSPGARRASASWSSTRPLERQRRDDAGAWLADPVALRLKSRRSSGSLLPGLARASMPMRGAGTVSSQGSIQTSRESRRLRASSVLYERDSHGSRRGSLARRVGLPDTLRGCPRAGGAHPRCRCPGAPAGDNRARELAGCFARSLRVPSASLTD
jgi:hypothetical protein